MAKLAKHDNSTLRELPVGMTEFNEFADRIIEKTGKIAAEDSMRWALANMIMHCKDGESAFNDGYFIQRLRRAAANQVASQVFQDVKIKQAEELAKQQAAATAKEAVSDETKTQEEN